MASRGADESSYRQRLREVVALFGQFGVIGFGGPMAHIAMMEREAVEKRAWLPRAHFLDALAVTNLLPGPNSTELGIHIGYVRARLAGAVAAGLAFILPAFGLMLLLSWLYFRYRTVPEVDDVFFGIQPVVIALIVATAYRLFRGAVTDLRLAAFFVAAGALTYAFPGWEIALLLGAAFAGLALYGTSWMRPPAALGLVAVLAAPPALSWQPGAALDAFLLSLRTGALLFGGGYVMIPLMQHDVVETFGWMTEAQFLDGVALGQTTPGPIVITATFVGYGAAGFLGATLATAGIFFPSFFFAVLSARFLEAIRGAPLMQAALKGIAAAVVGAILGATAHLARATLDDAWAIAIGAVGLLLILRWRVHSAPLIGAAALAGLAIGGVR